MAKKRPASEVARWQSPTRLWLDHAAVEEGDSEWMAQAQLLILWNVELPDDFLSRLPDLKGVSWRGGSATDLARLRGCDRLLMLDVNQIRGLNDLSVLSRLSGLEFLSLYGLPRVEILPGLAGLSALAYAQIGSMKGLKSLAGLLEAPALRSLHFIRHVAFPATELDALAAHPTLEEFDWFDEDVPRRVSEPAKSRLAHLRRPLPQRPEEWLAGRLR